MRDMNKLSPKSLRLREILADVPIGQDDNVIPFPVKTTRCCPDCGGRLDINDECIECYDE